MLKEIDNVSYKLEWAETFEEAVQKIGNNRYDAFLFDFNLGKRDGIDLLREPLVSMGKTPVIMLTGRGDLYIDKSAMKAGAADYLNKKHLKPEILERTIRYAIQHKRVLNERELLLKEVNHRVKNNFQLVSSLLQLEAENLSDSTAVRVLEDCRNRILTIALLHEKLYMSDNLVEIDAGGYFDSILKDLINSFSTPQRTVRYYVQSEDVVMAIKQLIHCGIIVNELVSNALKYAFPQKWKGDPAVSVTVAESEGDVTITIADNGVGIPDEFDALRSESMGMKLVSILVYEQLEGEVLFYRQNGTTATVRFKKMQ